MVFGQRTTLWWDLPLRDSLALVRRLYRVEAAAHRARLAELTALLELEPFLDTPVRQLSLGQRMRGDLAAALLHDPELLVLDEPTIGLDVVSKATVRDFLERINAERGTTILLTTHDLGDIERLCRRVMIIDHGGSPSTAGWTSCAAPWTPTGCSWWSWRGPARRSCWTGSRPSGWRGPGSGSGCRAPPTRRRSSPPSPATTRSATSRCGRPGIEEVLAGLYRGDHAYWCSGRPVAP